MYGYIWKNWNEITLTSPLLHHATTLAFALSIIKTSLPSLLYHHLKVTVIWQYPVQRIASYHHCVCNDTNRTWTLPPQQTLECSQGWGSCTSRPQQTSGQLHKEKGWKKNIKREREGDWGRWSTRETEMENIARFNTAGGRDILRKQHSEGRGAQWSRGAKWMRGGRH